MAAVHKSYGGRFAKLAEGEPPSKRLQSEGQQLIKELVKRQTDPHINLHDQLKRGKNFQAGSSYIPVSERIKGQSKLHDFLEVTHQIEREECGSTAKYSDSSLNHSTAYVTGGDFSRQDAEAALAVKPNSLETKLLRFALDNKLARNFHKKPCPTLPNDPINRLKDMEDQILADPVRLSKKYRKKRKKMLEASQAIQKPDNKPEEINPGDSLWDVVDLKKIELTSPADAVKEPKVYTCPKQNLYTIENGKIIKCREADEVPGVTEHGECIAVTFVKAERLSSVILNSKSDSEISELQRFTNYERGSPSNVLYVKNLPRNINEEEFSVVIAKAKKNCGIESKVTYRLLLSGKMRGQAFVNFESVKDATKVLDCMNGSEVKGRPMVIQFGKKGNSDQKLKNC